MWKNFIPEPFRVFIPVLTNGSVPAASVPVVAAAAEAPGTPGVPFPWNSFIPDPVKVFIPITPKVGDATIPSANDPVAFVAPSEATFPIPVFANGSFPWPPKPARKSKVPPSDSSNPDLNSWLPYPLNETYQVPDFAVPWLLFDPETMIPKVMPQMMPGAPPIPDIPKDEVKYSALNVDDAAPLKTDPAIKVCVKVLYSPEAEKKSICLLPSKLRKLVLWQNQTKSNQS